MVPFDQNDLAAAVASLMLSDPVASRPIPPLLRLLFKLKTSPPFLHMRCGVRADPDRQM